MVLTLDDIVTSGRARPALGGFPYAHATLAEVMARSEPDRWCAQCDRSVSGIRAYRCTSSWCKVK